MKKKIYFTLFYFFTLFQVSQNLFSVEEYQALDKVVAIVEKEVITEVELRNSINQVMASKKENSDEQYTDLVRASVLNELIQKSLIEQYANESGITIEQKKIDAFLTNIAKKNKLTIEELRNTIEKDGIKFGRFIDNIRYELLLKQIKICQD